MGDVTAVWITVRDHRTNEMSIYQRSIQYWMLHIQETNVNPELGYRVKVQAEDRTQQQSTGMRH